MIVAVVVRRVVEQSRALKNHRRCWRWRPDEPMSLIPASFARSPPDWSLHGLRSSTLPRWPAPSPAFAVSPKLCWLPPRPSSSGCCRSAASRRPRRRPRQPRFRERSRRHRPSGLLRAGLLTVRRLAILSRPLRLLHDLAAVPCRAARKLGRPNVRHRAALRRLPENGFAHRIEEAAGAAVARPRASSSWMRLWARFSASSCSRTVCTSA